MPLGLVGLVLAMLLLEMLRIGIEIAAWGMSRGVFLAYRAAVVAGLVAAGLVVLAVLGGHDSFADRIDLGQGLLARILQVMVQLDQSVLGHVATPFRPFVALVMANGITLRNSRRFWQRWPWWLG